MNFAVRSEVKKSSRISIAHGFELTNRLGERIKTPNLKANALLAYLALGASENTSREILAELLWSERPEARARASLRQCLRRLRSTIASNDLQDILEIGQLDVCLNRAFITFDLDEIVQSIGAGDISLDLIRSCNPDRLLYGYDDLDPEFTTWLRVMRVSWRDRLFSALQGAFESNDPKVSREAARAIFDLDPTRESAARVLIEWDLQNGDMALAFATYKMLWETLDEQWGEEPSQGLQAVIVAAKQDDYPQLPIAPSSRVGLETHRPEFGEFPSILVANFDQNGAWALPDYVIEGFRRELLASLVRFREWVVVERLETVTEASVYTLAGGYYEAQGSIFLTLTLRDNVNGQYVMSEQLIIESDGWNAALQRILSKLSLSINVNLIQRNTVLSDPARQVDGDIFQMWIRANHLLINWRENRFDQAMALFRQIIERAPDFGAAFSSMSSILSTMHLAAPGMLRDRDRENEALSLATQAVVLDPLDSRSHLALGWAHAMKGNFSRAELHFNHCNELNPNNAKTMVPSAQGLSYCGAKDRAQQIADQALNLHPQMLPSHWGYLMCIRFFARRYDEAIEASQVAGTSVLDFIAWRAAALALSGDRATAKEEGARFLAAIRDVWTEPEPATDEAIMHWFLQCFPIRHQSDREKLLEGLRLAGLPVDAH